jgi:hypothetical protein
MKVRMQTIRMPPAIVVCTKPPFPPAGTGMHLYFSVFFRELRGYFIYLRNL